MTKKTAILFHMKTWSYDCSTYVGSFIVIEGAGCKCTRTVRDDHCTTSLFKDERETKERDRTIVFIQKYMSTEYESEIFYIIVLHLPTQYLI